MTHPEAQAKTCPLRGAPCLVAPCMMWADTMFAIRERGPDGTLTGMTHFVDHPIAGAEREDISPVGRCTLGSPR